MVETGPRKVGRTPMLRHAHCVEHGGGGRNIVPLETTSTNYGVRGFLVVAVALVCRLVQCSLMQSTF